MNLKKILETTAQEVPQKTAIIFKQQKVTYRELDEVANRIANALTTTGLKRG